MSAFGNIAAGNEPRLQQRRQISSSAAANHAGAAEPLRPLQPAKSLMFHTPADDTSDMKFLFHSAAIAACWFCLEPGAVRADDQLPMPKMLVDDDGPKYSSSDFNRLLQQMRAEREAMRSDWQSLVKKNSPPPSDPDVELQKHLKAILQHLKSRSAPAPTQPESGSPPTNPAGEGKDPKEPTPGPPHSVTTDKAPQTPTAVDVVSEALAHFRARQFEDALATFRLVELKGQRADVRAPVEYLMAMCMLHLGKNEEALPLLREVANSRGDEKLAGYAQWQLEMLRWQRNVQDRLQEIRQRRESLEKR
jgi:hypothetical protein